MKHTALFLIFVLTVTGSALVPGAQSPSQQSILRPNFPTPVRDSLLNGLQLAVVERPATSNVAINFTIRGGSMFDVYGKGGTASLTAELLLKGGTKGRSPQTISQTIDATAPDFKITTNWDATIFTATTSPEYVSEVLALIGEIIAGAAFDKDAFEKVKTEHIDRLKRAQLSQDELAKSVLYSKLYPLYPFGHPLDGTAQSIANINRGDIFDFYKKFYLANNASLVVVGAIGRQSIIDAARSGLGRLLKGENVPITFSHPTPPAKNTVFLVDQPNAKDSYVALGQLGINRSNDDYLPIMLLNHALGGSPNSLLAKRLGADRMPATELGAYRLSGPWVVTEQTTTGNTAAVVAETMKILNEAHGQGLPAAEVDAAKDYFVRSYPLQFETNAQVAQRLSEIELYGIGRDYPVTFQQRVAAVTTDQVHTAASTFLQPNAMVIVAVGPASQLKESLAQFGPVEIVPAQQATK